MMFDSNNSDQNVGRGALRYVVDVISKINLFMKCNNKCISNRVPLLGKGSDRRIGRMEAPEAMKCLLQLRTHKKKQPDNCYFNRQNRNCYTL